jgi:hypothetical protein
MRSGYPAPRSSYPASGRRYTYKDVAKAVWFPRQELIMGVFGSGRAGDLVEKFDVGADGVVHARDFGIF